MQSTENGLGQFSCECHKAIKIKGIWKKSLTNVFDFSTFKISGNWCKYILAGKTAINNTTKPKLEILLYFLNNKKPPNKISKNPLM